MYYTSRRWSFIRIQTCWAWRAQDTVVCLQRKTCCPCKRGKSKDKFFVDEGLILSSDWCIYTHACLYVFIQFNVIWCIFSPCWFVFVGNRFPLLELHSTMMTFLFWIQSLRSSNLMVPTHPFKRGLKHWKLFSTLKILIMMGNVR